MNGTYRTLSRLAALLGLCMAVWAPASQAQIAPPLTNLHSFTGGVDGASPIARLIQAKDGNLYGTTTRGGTSGWGTVFKITPSGTLTTLHSGTDTALPQSGLIQAKDGYLYGTSEEGGANGMGTIYKITPSGVLTILYSFSPLSPSYPFINSDGTAPLGRLIQGTDGNLYGTAFAGGSNDLGTVFKITTGGTFTTLHSFSGNPVDGSQPFTGLIEGNDGNLYGTTYDGGAWNAGTVFKITPSGVLTILYSFTGAADGGNPKAGLIQGTDGGLYGTTEVGGASDYGTVFKITPSGALTTLYSFTGAADGGVSSGGLLQCKDGNLYGTCAEGGADGSGTVFKITTSGVLTTLYSFTGGADGGAPKAGLIEGKDGNLYGTCPQGGADGNGGVFKLTMPPVIKSFSPIGGPIGTSVSLTGVNFTGATAVKFGSTPVSFTINSDTSLTFAVPVPGAASAKITVSNVFGSGVSSKAFKMTPVISSFSPASGPVGTLVTLTGVNFLGATSVEVGTLPATFIILSDTSLKLVVPTGAVTAKITVVNSFGTGTSAKSFTVTP
jgi:uncharacterized repeat protein (TIGR03803 family)